MKTIENLRDLRGVDRRGHPGRQHIRPLRQTYRRSGTARFESLPPHGCDGGEDSALPLCVVAVSLAGRRWGMGVAGVLGGLPVVAGPILLVETLLHGPVFGADAAAGTLLALAALTAFVVVFGRGAGRLKPIACALCGWSAFLLDVLILSFVQPPPVASLIFVGACFALGSRLLPPAAGAVAAGAAPPRWDLPARGGAALLMVLGLTAISGALGPHLSGLLAPFPIITSVLAIFTYAHAGVEQVVLLLRNFLLGFYGFATFCFVLAIHLPDLPTAAAFGAATAAALIVQSAILVLRSRLAPTPLEQGA
ncbi:MAG TPA: hypothetical protein VLC07_10060 [Solirubrobacterales bacterium]|nr:hypothetical protein [Solirubrobacterales bacterium]